jgi:YVTN family beta-propeller protein
MSLAAPLRLGLLVLALLISSAAVGTAQTASASLSSSAASASTLDFDAFKSTIQPIFLARREGLVRCVTCHAGKVGTRLRLQPLAEGATTWTDEQARKNFESASSLVAPGRPMDSRLLLHPLDRQAGGDSFHGGGKHWRAQSDPEWQALSAWVRGVPPATGAANRPGATAVRIIQTNAAGDTSHVIDPATNRVVGVMKGTEIPHGVTSAPDGSRLYLSNESLETLDAFDAKTLTLTKRVPLSGRPNNVSVSKDGRKVYVGIAQAPGALDVIDTASMTRVKTVPVTGSIHNVYVTPDGKFAVAGSIPATTISIVDTATDTMVRSIKLSAGIRPMAFDTNPDGSTRNIYVQLSDFHGFVVVDFASGKETARIEHPPIPGEHAHTDGLQGAPAHGLAVSPDGTRLWCTSKVYGYAYVHSLPDLKEVGRVFVGQHPEWVTFTPDGRFIYVAAAGDNMVFVIDAQAMKEVARIPVGQVPKRNATALLQTMQ